MEAARQSLLEAYRIAAGLGIGPRTRIQPTNPGTPLIDRLAEASFVLHAVELVGPPLQHILVARFMPPVDLGSEAVKEQAVREFGAYYVRHANLYSVCDAFFVDRLRLWSGLRQHHPLCQWARFAGRSERTLRNIVNGTARRVGLGRIFDLYLDEAIAAVGLVIEGGCYGRVDGRKHEADGWHHDRYSAPRDVDADVCRRPVEQAMAAGNGYIESHGGTER